MAGSWGDEERNLESALLFVGRSTQALAALVTILLPMPQLEELARAAGRRKAGATDPGQVVADQLVHAAKLRRQVVSTILETLPPAEELPEDLLAEDRVQWLRREALLSQLRVDFGAGDPEDWSRGAGRAAAWAELILEEQNGSVAAQPRPARSPAPPTPEGGDAARLVKVERELKGLDQRLGQSQQEVVRLQDELGRERKRREQLREELEDFRQELAREQNRATDLKKKLKGASAASEREEVLADDLTNTQRELHLLEQKFQILQEERDDLHGVLEDMDRYLAMEPEEVPSFRDRPLQPEEMELIGRLEERRARGMQDLRILVIGGGEPQHRHMDKFEEYAERIGFRGQWRMAEYTAWHKEMDRLAADMERSFDALVILHWNRTTFTRKAREICNNKGQKPCITCHYEGFVSLRRTLQTCLRQLLERESPPPS